MPKWLYRNHKRARSVCLQEKDCTAMSIQVLPQHWTCSCSISKPPTCPSGSTVSPRTALCTGTVPPKCPTGFDLKDNCECVSARIRQCSAGMLSPNGCTCEDVVVSTPKCSSGCSLNGACRCESGCKNYGNFRLYTT